MSLFLNTLAVCAGIVAVYVIYHAARLLMFFVIGLVTLGYRRWREQALAEAVAARKAQVEQELIASKAARVPQVREYLEVDDVRRVVAELVNYPYKSGYSRAVERNNKQRSRLLADLRALIPDADVRKDIYSEPARWLESAPTQ